MYSLSLSLIHVCMYVCICVHMPCQPQPVCWTPSPSPPHPLDLYGRDLVRAIIQVKWESYARAFLLMQVRSCVRVPCRGPEALLL